MANFAFRRLRKALGIGTYNQLELITGFWKAAIANKLHHIGLKANDIPAKKLKLQTKGQRNRKFGFTRKSSSTR